MINTLWENIFKKEKEDKSISKILGENIVFQTLTKKELRFMETIVHERHFRKGEYVFHQGEVGVGMYIIAKGTIDITLDEAQEETSSHERTIVTKLEGGDFFGELSLVEENSRRSASAVASEESWLLGFFKPDLMDVLERNPQMGVKIVFRLSEVLGKRLRETTNKISYLKKELIKYSNESPDISEIDSHG